MNFFANLFQNGFLPSYPGRIGWRYSSAACAFRISVSVKVLQLVKNRAARINGVKIRFIILIINKFVRRSPTLAEVFSSFAATKINKLF